MELDYELHGETAKIFYAETLVSQLKSLKIEQSVLFLTNQRYYDLFADKINQLFANPRKIDWYICANTQCNHLIELSNLLTFAKRYPENEAFLIIGFGNEGDHGLGWLFSKTYTAGIEAMAYSSIYSLNGSGIDTRANHFAAA